MEETMKKIALIATLAAVAFSTAALAQDDSNGAGYTSQRRSGYNYPQVVTIDGVPCLMMIAKCTRPDGMSIYQMPAGRWSVR
jgi:hypothetical protein